ncbi:MAG: aminopeptidase P family protein [Bacteroidales bacterium]|nr:aminopeptidase P family protein [Bacteroidales bacterium]
MFQASVYTNRRARLHKLMKSGIVLLPGNNESAMNYLANTYHYRQDSNFSYFFALCQPGLVGVMDLDNDKDIIFGDDLDMDDIIWMGPQPTMKDRAALAGVKEVMPSQELFDFIQKATNAGRTIHYLPSYRGETVLWFGKILGISPDFVKNYTSKELIKAVVQLREIKEDVEIKAIEEMVDVAYEMQTTAMKMAKPGVIEQEIFGTIEGIALAKASGTSFPIILSIDGQTLHNHFHGNTLVPGRMMVIDCGAESHINYCSDITRTVPVGGKFNERQKSIYNIVLKANMDTIAATKPGVLNRDIHLLAAKTIAQGLKDLGLMKGDIDAAVSAGAHALFFPHGLGHMMGMDVHDMEGLGENNVGYDEEISRASQFGLAFLRLGKRLKPGFVLTIEPGIYFIPALIDQWKAEGKCAEFINYDKVETYKDFGGIRLEDDILVTETGHRVLGKPIPKTVEEIEAMMA